jgi:hypothetical protein
MDLTLDVQLAASNLASPPSPNTYPCLAQVDLDALRKLAWGGIPAEVRPDCWRLLLGYMPPAK